jgi:hypothetical protein
VEATVRVLPLPIAIKIYIPAVAHPVAVLILVMEQVLDLDTEMLADQYQLHRGLFQAKVILAELHTMVLTCPGKQAVAEVEQAALEILELHCTPRATVV